MSAERRRPAAALAAAAAVCTTFVVSGVARAAPFLDAQLPPTATGPDEARRTAEQILAQPEFQPAEPTLLERIVTWIFDQLGKLFDAPLPGDEGSRGVIAWLVLGALVLVAAFLVWRFVQGRSPRASSAPAFDIELTLLRSAEQWRAEAERLERDGAWKQALRARYRALIAELVDEGVVGDLPGRTIGEYRIEVRRSVPAAAAPFGGASDLFERAWYGDLPTGEEENRRIRDLTGTVQAAVAAARTGRPSGDDGTPAPLEVPA